MVRLRPIRLPALAPLFAVLLLGGAAPAAAVTQGVHPAPDASALHILSTSSFIFLGDLYIAGELKNRSSSRLKDVRVDARLYNAHGKLLKKDYGLASLDIIKPGVVSPFLVITHKPKGYDHYRLSTSSRTTHERPVGKLSVQEGTPDTTSGQLDFPGDLKNGNGFKVSDAKVILTMYDAHGKVINTVYTITDPAGRIPARSSRHYRLIAQAHFDFNHYKLQTEAIRA